MRPRYLSYLHGLFNGDWLLALAAYAGEGTVSRAIERNQKLGLPTDYWNLPLPQARDYVPKLLALSQLIRAPEAYGINLNPIANEPISKSSRSSSAWTGTRRQTRRPRRGRALPAEPGVHPADHPGRPAAAARTHGESRMLAANLALMKPQELVDWQQYQVRAGDTLGTIANRHHLTVNIIRDVNRLKSDSLRVGQVLSIPTSGDAQASRELLHAVARQPAATPRSYRVKPGDNLWDIAKAQRVSVRDLQRWNKLSGSQLKVGGRAVPAGPGSKRCAKERQCPTYYKVQKGDSLYQIAKRFNVQLTNLKHGTRAPTCCALANC